MDLFNGKIDIGFQFLLDVVYIKDSQKFFNVFNGCVDVLLVDIIYFVLVEVVEYCVEKIVCDWFFFFVDDEYELLKDKDG